MPDWIPLKHQIDALRMDVQYILRFTIKRTDQGKVWRSNKGDFLPFIMEQKGLLKQVDESFSAGHPALWQATSFGRKQVDNDHAMREIAMEWMDFLPAEAVNTLQHDLFHWLFRDPKIRAFMQEMASMDGGPTLDDFLPQAPWYYHTVGPRNTPNRLRDKEAEELYVRGGYTGKEGSVYEMIHKEEVA